MTSFFSTPTPLLYIISWALGPLTEGLHFNKMLIVGFWDNSVTMSIDQKILGSSPSEAECPLFKCLSSIAPTNLSLGRSVKLDG